MICAFEIIEHLFDPKSILLDMRRILNKKGIILISTPNVEGFEMSVLEKVCDTYFAPTHLNYFSIKTLPMLLENCGFEVLKIETPGQLDIEISRKKVLQNKIKLKNQFLKTILIDKYDEIGEKFQKFLQENKLSSHMWITARKCEG